MNEKDSDNGRRLAAVALLIVNHLPAWILARLSGAGNGTVIFGGLVRWILDPLRHMDVTIPRGECAGVRFNPAGSAPSFALGTSELEVQAALAGALRPGCVFYDIGANVGYFTILGGGRVGASGEVYAFEPLPANVSGLRRNVAMAGLRNVTVVQHAVLDRCAPLDFRVSREPFWGRLAYLPPPPRAVGVIRVEGISVDHFIACGRGPAPHVVKIDVEGAEVAVLRGMSNTLRTSRPVIVCEVHGSSNALFELLEAAGYRYRWLAKPGRRRPSRHIVATFDQ